MNLETGSFPQPPGTSNRGELNFLSPSQPHDTESSPLTHKLEWSMANHGRQTAVSGTWMIRTAQLEAWAPSQLAVHVPLIIPLISQYMTFYKNEHFKSYLSHCGFTLGVQAQNCFTDRNAWSKSLAATALSYVLCSRYHSLPKFCHKSYRWERRWPALGEVNFRDSRIKMFKENNHTFPSRRLKQSLSWYYILLRNYSLVIKKMFF